jgi:hypothetical protein
VIQALVNEVAEKLGPEPEWEKQLRLAGLLPLWNRGASAPD